MKKTKTDAGFTLVELIMVIVIVGILASVAVPKFVNLSDAANKAKCAANRGAINSAVVMAYAARVAEDPTQAEMLATFTIDSVSADMFATNAIPVCPTGGTYTLTNGQVTCGTHGV